MALQMIRRAHYPMPIGQTPGHLSSAINLHATSGVRSDGSRYSVYILWKKEASTSHRPVE